MRFITMDDESRDLLEAAGEMAHAALQARARRRDPDEIISRSVTMSRIKTKGILDQLRQPPLAKFEQLSAQDRATLVELISVWSADFDEVDCEAWFSSLRAICLRRAQDEPSETAEIITG